MRTLPLVLAALLAAPSAPAVEVKAKAKPVAVSLRPIAPLAASRPVAAPAPLAAAPKLPHAAVAAPAAAPLAARFPRLKALVKSVIGDWGGRDAPPAAEPPAATAVQAPPATERASVRLLRSSPEIRRLPGDIAAPLAELRARIKARGREDLLPLVDRVVQTDPLTGLPNRVFLDLHADERLRAMREPAVAVLDLNFFGSVNEGMNAVHGPARGREKADGVLRSMAGGLGETASARGAVAARLGDGEEFVLLGEQEKMPALIAELKRLYPSWESLQGAGFGRDSPEGTAISAAVARRGGGDTVADFTFGVASARGKDFTTAVAAADDALLEAKRRGARGHAFERGEEGVRPLPLPAAAEPARAARQADGWHETFIRLGTELPEGDLGLLADAAFTDRLTLARRAEWIEAARPEWDKRFEGTRLAIVSARNLKEINDALGHAGGDEYLRALGAALRAATGQSGLRVEPAVRVQGKDFVLIGPDAEKAAEAARERFETALREGRVLPLAGLRKAAALAVERGSAPADRAEHLGGLRVAAVPYQGGFRDSFDRANAALESQKTPAAPETRAPAPETVRAPPEPEPEPEERIGTELGPQFPRSLRVLSRAPDGPLNSLFTAYERAYGRRDARAALAIVRNIRGVFHQRALGWAPYTAVRLDAIELSLRQLAGKDAARANNVVAAPAPAAPAPAPAEPERAALGKVLPVTAKQAVKALTRLGFTHERSKGSHQIYKRMGPDGVERTLVIPMHGSQSLDRMKVRDMLFLLQEFGITQEQFRAEF